MGANEFGFKKLSPANWLTIDPVWSVFANPYPALSSQEAWLEDVLKNNLEPFVPTEIKKLFEVARGALVYGQLYYPLLTIGTEQLYRVAEAAVTAKCLAMGAPSSVRRFSAKIMWLGESGAIKEVQHLRWDGLKEVRNITSHPRMQEVVDPNLSLDMLNMVAELINQLFSRPSVEKIPPRRNDGKAN